MYRLLCSFQRAMLSMQLAARARGVVTSPWHSSSSWDSLVSQFTAEDHVYVSILMQSQGSTARRSAQVWGRCQIRRGFRRLPSSGKHTFTSFWLVNTWVTWGIGASIPKLPACACKHDTVCVRLNISWEGEVQAGHFYCISNRWCCDANKS